MTNSTHVIRDDLPLLKTMLADSQSQPPIYKPGKYWRAKTKNAVREIEKFGLNDFRGSSNSIGTSFSDNMYCDVRTQLSFGPRKPFRFLFEKIFPFKSIFNAQVSLTCQYAQDIIDLRSYAYSTSAHIADLASRYTVPYSIAGGCVDCFEYQGKKISHHYMNLLDTHASVAKSVDFSKARSFFEIGGGFGVNFHLLIENYKNLRKFICLDIPPNLYVGTQYLKSFYGDKVRDYRSTRALNEIAFSPDNDLEILCIAPWQIEKLKTSVDILYNAHSFVEMTPDIIKNYVRHIEQLPSAEQMQVALVSYGNFNAATTIHPDLLQDFFRKEFRKTVQDVMPDGTRKNLIYTSL